jgi:hypothetical protein
MDPQSIAVTLKGAWDIFKGVKEAVALIPDPVQKAKALTELALLQQQLSAKDIEIAKNIGYELCLAHAPIPGIMVDTGEEWRCTVEGCPRTKETAQGAYNKAKRLSGGQRNSIGTPRGY